MSEKDIFECYGIHLDIPELQYFKGGFIIKGDFKHLDVNNKACVGLQTNGADLLGRMFAPEIIRGKIQQLDFLYDHVESINPTFASYFVKPTDLIQKFSNEGLAGVSGILGHRAEHILSKTGSTAKIVESL